MIEKKLMDGELDGRGFRPVVRFAERVELLIKIGRKLEAT